MTEKRKRGRPKKVTPTNGSEHRVVTIKNNTPDVMFIAPEAVGVDLGPVVLPEPEQAVQVLRVLAELNNRVLHAHARLVEQQTKTKAAKGKWEELAAELQTKLRAATHGSDLPLFDPIEREQDEAGMLAAVGAQSTQDETSPVEQAKEARSDSSASDVF